MSRTPTTWTNFLIGAGVVTSTFMLLTTINESPFLSVTVSAQQGLVVGRPVAPRRIAIDLRLLPTVPPWQLGDPIIAPRGQQSPPGPEIAQAGPEPTGVLDPLVRSAPTGLAAAASLSGAIVSFDGIFTGVGPPDTVGDVGPNHYISARNSQFQIFDKQGTSPF